jgi:hypothetical protein
MVQSCKDQNKAGTSIVFDHPREISSLELMTNQRKNVTITIQPKFVY